MLLLLLFSVEYVGDGSLSVYRLCIFPLSLIGCILIGSKPTFAIARTYSVLIIILLLWLSVCQTVTDNNPLFPIMMMPLAWFIIHFYYMENRPEVEYAKIFSAYSLPHIISLLLGVHNILGGRFAGLHVDPNFCGIFLSIGIVGAFTCLFNRPKWFVLRLYYVFIVIMSLLLLFWTGSRGAMLSFALIILYYFYRSKKVSLWLKILSVAVILIGYNYLMSYINSLPSWVSPDESIVDSILCRFQSDSMSEGSRRKDLWTHAFNSLINSDYLTPIGSAQALMGTNYIFVHNTFIDFMLELGLVEGMVLNIVLLFCMGKGFSLIVKGVYNEKEKVFTLICVIVLVELFFLSAYSQKIVWLSIIYLICSTNKFFYKNLSTKK